MGKKDDYAAKVKRMLESEGMELTGSRHKIEVWNDENGAVVNIFTLSSKGRTQDLFTLTTNEEGYVHPALAISKILEAWGVALDLRRYIRR